MTTPSSPKPVPVRIPADLVARIDALRGLIPREAFVRWMLTEYLPQLEASSSEFMKDTRMKP